MKIGFGANNVVAAPWERPQFELKNGERGRVCLIDKEPEMEIAHWVNTATGKQKGYFGCFGRYEVIFGKQGQGLDPEQCDFCKYASQGQGAPIGMPSRRFGSHVFKYVTDMKGEARLFNGMPAMECIAWRFGDDKFRRISELSEKAPKLSNGEPDMRQMDLLCVCKGEQYQKFDIDPCGVVPGSNPPVMALWLISDVIKQQAVALYRQEYKEMTDGFLCTHISKEQAARMCAEVMGGTQQGAPGTMPATPPPITNPQELQSVLDGIPVGAQPTQSSFPTAVAQPMPVAQPQPMPTAPVAVGVPSTAQPSPIQPPTPVAAVPSPPTQPPVQTIAPPTPVAQPAIASTTPAQAPITVEFDSLLNVK